MKKIRSESTPLKRCSDPSLHNFKEISLDTKCEWCKEPIGKIMNEALKEIRDKKQLHLGCGKRHLPGNWLHIDIDNYDHIDIVHDIKTLPMFKDNTVDEEYSCGVFEYFDREEAPTVLKEWYRVLKPKGIMRISVPDFESIIKVYQKYNDIEHKGILGPLYGRIEITKIEFIAENPFMIDGPEKEEIVKELLFHKTVYDFKSLKKLLESVGFKNIHRYNAEEVLPKGYDDFSLAYIPDGFHKKGIQIMLNVECEK